MGSLMVIGFSHRQQETDGRIQAEAFLASAARMRRSRSLAFSKVSSKASC